MRTSSDKTKKVVEIKFSPIYTCEFITLLSEALISDSSKRDRGRGVGFEWEMMKRSFRDERTAWRFVLGGGEGNALGSGRVMLTAKADFDDSKPQLHSH